MAKDMNRVLETLKVSAGAMTADVAVLGLKIVFGETLGGVLGTGVKEFLKQIKDKNKEELKGIKVPAEIQKEIQEQLKQYMMEQKHPLYMNGVVFFFENMISDEDEGELRCYIEHDYEEEEDDDIINKQKIVDDILGGYGYDNYEIIDDILYINFDDVTGDKLYAEDEIRQMAHALNYLRGVQYSGNAIESFCIF